MANGEDKVTIVAAGGSYFAIDHDTQWRSGPRPRPRDARAEWDRYRELLEEGEASEEEGPGRPDGAVEVPLDTGGIGRVGTLTAAAATATPPPPPKEEQAGTPTHPVEPAPPGSATEADVPDGSIDEVVGWVEEGSDDVTRQARAASALEVERAKGDDARVTLVERLEELAVDTEPEVREGE